MNINFFRILMLILIYLEISILSYVFAKKGKYVKTVNIFILYLMFNVFWFITQLLIISPIINQDSAIYFLKFKSLFWNIPTLVYLWLILSLTKTKLTKTLYFLLFIEILSFLFVISTNFVINEVFLRNGFFINNKNIFTFTIPAFNLIPLAIIYVTLLNHYRKNSKFKKEYLILFYLSLSLLVIIPLTITLEKNLNIIFSIMLPIWGFINSLVTFLIIKKIFLSIDYEEFTNKLFNNIQDGIIITNKNDKIVIINDITEEIISKLINIDLIYLKPSEIFKNYDCNTKYKNKKFNLKNTEHEVMISQSILNNKISEFKSIITIKDLSIEKLLQEELIKSQKLQSISVFIGGIAHDFGNILTGILGNTTYLKMKLESDDEEISTILKDTENIILQAKGLTKQLLDYSKIKKSKNKKNISIEKIIQSSISLALSGTDISVNTKFDSNLYDIYGDEIQLEQIFNNLLINAKQSINSNGRIHIKIKKVLIENQYIQFLEPGKYLEITVTDNGVGIAKDKLHKIFTPYFTTKKTGNGLGLAIVSSIIKNHNGYINVESKINKGTSFTIYLPESKVKNKIIKVSKDKLITSKKHDNLIKNNLSNKILIMDDEEMILKISERILKILEYDPILAKNGTEVLNYLENNPNTNIPIFILDLTIPGDIGGKELAPKIKKILPNTKIIVSSGYLNKDEIINFKDYFFDDRLIKPYTIEDLKNILPERRDE